MDDGGSSAKWVTCTLKKGDTSVIRGQVESKGPWGYTVGGRRAVMRRRRKDPQEDAQFKPGTNHFWIRLFPKTTEANKAAAVWVFENESPGKDKYQTRCGDFLVRMIEFKACATAKEAEEAKFGMYPAHWNLHKFIITWH